MYNLVSKQIKIFMLPELIELFANFTGTIVHMVNVCVSICGGIIIRIYRLYPADMCVYYILIHIIIGFIGNRIQNFYDIIQLIQAIINV